MADVKEQIKLLMRRVRERGGLPNSAAIVDEAFRELGYVQGALRPEETVNRFGDILRRVWEETLPVLERHEERAYAEGIPRELASQCPGDVRDAENVATEAGFAAGASRLFALWYPYLRRCFLSISQSRMQRGGEDFELQIQRLLHLAGVPFEPQDVAHRTDLVLPSREVFERNRTVAAVVSVKRTLRERWAEVAEELFNLRSPNVFLFTADEKVTLNHVKRVCEEYNIYLVVWDTLKEAKFPQHPLVLGFTQWAAERLAILRQHW